MIKNLEINSKQIDKIKEITLKEKNFRVKNLELFKAAGFPTKRLEDWKFSDFKNIVDTNFNHLDTKNNNLRIRPDRSIPLIIEGEFFSSKKIKGLTLKKEKNKNILYFDKNRQKRYDLKITFLKSANPGIVIAAAKVIKLGKSVAFVEGTLSNSNGDLIAKGTSTNKLVPMPKQ